MRIFHITRRHLALTGGFLVLAVGVSVFLGGCFQRQAPADTVSSAANDEERAAFFARYGWEIDTKAVETLDLTLPADLNAKWADYVAMQTAQGLPFADYGGQTVRRYTYLITNASQAPQGTQANLYQCGDTIIGADIIYLGEGGGQYGLKK